MQTTVLVKDGESNLLDILLCTAYVPRRLIDTPSVLAIGHLKKEEKNELFSFLAEAFPASISNKPGEY